MVKAVVLSKLVIRADTGSLGNVYNNYFIISYLYNKSENLDTHLIVVKLIYCSKTLPWQFTKYM